MTGQWNRVPMEATPASRMLCERAKKIASGLGISLDAVAWGGASDANIAAHAGAATVDGFGPVGDWLLFPSTPWKIDW